MMKKSLIAIGVAMSFSANANLIITETTEGSSYNKAIELTNTGKATISDLSIYSIKIMPWSSKATSSDWNGEFKLPAVSLESGKTFVVAHTKLAAGYDGDKIDAKSSVVGNFNGNDPLGLFKNGTLFDLVGYTDKNENYNKDGVIRRKGTAIQPSTTYNSDSWEIIPGKDNFTHIGTAPTFTPVDGGDGGDGGNTIETTTIMKLQGEGWVSPKVDPANNKWISDKPFIIEGVITAIQESALGDKGDDLPIGYFVQDENGDGNAKTSDAIFITTNDVSGREIGEKVKITGKVEEAYGWTTLKQEAVEQISTGNSITAVSLERLDTDPYFDYTLERHEGMLVTIDSKSNMKVSRSFSEDVDAKRNNMVLSYGNISVHPNENNLPGSDKAAKVVACTDDERLIVESKTKADNNGNIPWYPNYGSTTDDYIRVGSTVNGLTGVVGYSYSDFRLFVTQNVTKDNFTNNERPDPKILKKGDIVLASFNASDFVTTDATFDLKTGKIAKALQELNADVIGLTGVQNNGFTSGSAIYAILDKLNELYSDDAQKYKIAKNDSWTDSVGSSKLANFVLFRDSKLEINSIDDFALPAQKHNDKDSNLVTNAMANSIIANFNVIATKDRKHSQAINVVVNDLINRDTSCSEDISNANNPQGGCAALRITSADYIGKQLNNKVGHKILLGNFNSYKKETAITVLSSKKLSGNRAVPTAENAYVLDSKGNETSLPTQNINKTHGYIDVINWLNQNNYTYAEGELVGTTSYIMMSPSLKRYIQDAQTWSVNAAESKFVVSDTNSNNAFRSSEHDPIALVLNFDVTDGKPDPASTPKMKDKEHVLIPEDAPEKPKAKVEKNKSFKLSMNLAKANESASSPLTVGDYARLTVSKVSQSFAAFSASYTSTSEVELEAYHFETGVVELEVAPLIEGEYQLKETILGPERQSTKYSSPAPVYFEVEQKTDTSSSSSSSSGGSVGYFALLLITLIGRFRRHL